MDVGYKMRRENRVLHVSKDRVPSLLSQGYDLIGANGKIIRRATGGRSISLPAYNKLAEGNEELKRQLKQSQELNAELLEKIRAKDAIEKRDQLFTRDTKKK